MITLKMIKDKSGRSEAAIRRALKAHGITGLSQAGMKGFRYTMKEINLFLSRHWPDSPRFE